MGAEAYEGWAVVEMFGHVRLAGKVSEADQYGVKMLRVDIPEVDGHPAFTTYKAGTALFAVTPVSEEVALAVVRQERPAPPIPYALQQRAIAPIADAELSPTGLKRPTLEDEDERDEEPGF